MSVTSDPAKHRAVGAEEVHEARTGDMQGIVHGRVLQGVRHRHHGFVVETDYVYAEGRISRGTRPCSNCRRRRIIDPPRPENLRLLEAGVVNLDLAGSEIGGQKKTAGRVLD